MLLCFSFSASIEACAALVWTVCVCVCVCVCVSGGRDLEVSLFFLEMWNIFPIDSREACLSVPRAHSPHCRSSFTAELFILVSRASQLTHWGALCGESSLSVRAHLCVCVCASALVLVSV